MTREVVTARPEMPIKKVATLLIEHGISGMPVLDDDRRVVGVVSEGDLLVKEQGADAVDRRPLARIFGDSRATRAQLAKVRALTAGDAMTAPAITTTPDASVTEAAATMTRRQINRLPVVEGEVLVGMISRADLVRAFVRSDEELAATIRDEVLYRTLWLDPARFDVAVTNGKVRILGRVERRSTAEMIERVISLVPGVVGVAAELPWEVDDRNIEAPERDLLSPYTAP
jgi:CBS domain-containing protein